MGRGNVCTTGPYEGVFYIDRDYVAVYRLDAPYEDDVPTCLLHDLDHDQLSSGKWYLDEEGSDTEEEDVLECFCDEMKKLCPSFDKVDKNLFDFLAGRKRHVVLENRLFRICVDDNEWSLAVELIERDDYGRLEGLQKRHYRHYLECMKKALLSRLPSIGIYTGPWTHGTITREEAGLC